LDYRAELQFVFLIETFAAEFGFFFRNTATKLRRDFVFSVSCRCGVMFLPAKGSPVST